MKTIIVMSITFAVMTLTSQAQEFYTVIDKDGYTNIREKPTANAKIIDKASKYELLFSADYFCGSDRLDFSDVNTNWIPVQKDYSASIGYVYKKNICPFNDMPMLESKIRNPQDPETIICSNDTLMVCLILKSFDFDTHKIEYAEVEYDVNKRLHIDGELPKGIFASENSREIFVNYWEIEGLIINKKEKQYLLPIHHIKGYYNPNGMTVWIGPEGELYIHIYCGDGGEAYSIMLSVVNGEVLFAKESNAC